MAKVTGAFTTYGAKGNREQLENMIYNIDPFETPLMNLADRRNVAGRQFDWQVESLPARNTTADIEGGTYTFANATATARVYNNTQTNSRNATVSRTQQKVDAAGKGEGEMAHQMTIVTKSLKLDMDTAGWSASPRVDGDDGTARYTRGLEHFIQTNAFYNANTNSNTATIGANASSPTTALTDGTQRKFTKERLDDAIEQTWTNGGKPTTLVVSPYNKRLLSQFTPRQGTFVTVDKTNLLGGSVSVYLSDFGDFAVVPCRTHRFRTVFGIDPKMVKFCYLRNFEVIEPGITGSANTKVLEAEWGLQCSNEKAHFKIADLAGTAAEAATALV